MRGEIIVGRLVTGMGQGRHFTRLDWARQQFVEKLGIDPFPGTLNLIVEDPKYRPAWARLKAEAGVPIDNPNDGPNDCNGRAYAVLIEGRIDAAIVVPEVPSYPPDQLELISPLGIRNTLGVADGDQVRLEVKSNT